MKSIWHNINTHSYTLLSLLSVTLQVHEFLLRKSSSLALLHCVCVCVCVACVWPDEVFLVLTSFSTALAVSGFLVGSYTSVCVCVCLFVRGFMLLLFLDWYPGNGSMTNGPLVQRLVPHRNRRCQ